MGNESFQREREKKTEILDYITFTKKQKVKHQDSHTLPILVKENEENLVLLTRLNLGFTTVKWNWSHGRKVTNLRKENTFAIFLKAGEESRLYHGVMFLKYS